MVGTRCRQPDNTYYDFRPEHAINGEFRFMSDKNRTRDTKANNEAIRSVSQGKPAQLMRTGGSGIVVYGIGIRTAPTGLRTSATNFKNKFFSSGNCCKSLNEEKPVGLITKRVTLHLQVK